MPTGDYWQRSLGAFGAAGKMNTITFRSQGVERRWTGRILRINDKSGLIVQWTDGPRRLCRWEDLVSISDARPDNMKAVS